MDRSTDAARTSAAYDTVADTYERRFANELDAKPRDRELLDGIASRDAGVALDVGCGPGQIGAHLTSRGRDVVGVDLSLAMAQRAADRLAAAVRADMLGLPFRSASVSDIVAFYSLIHLPRGALGSVFTEIARVLQPGGHVLVSAHEGDGDVEVADFLGHTVEVTATFFTLDELVTAARVSGLSIVSAERRAPYDEEGSTVRLYVEAAKATDDGDIDLELLASTPAAFRRALDVLGEQRFWSRPAPDEWSPAEILTHVRAADAVIAPRVMQVLVRPGMALADLDERAIGDRLARVQDSTLDAIAGFEARRRELIGLVATLTDEERRRHGQHETCGRVTLADICRNLLDHEHDHLRQLDAAIAALLSEH